MSRVIFVLIVLAAGLMTASAQGAASFVLPNNTILYNSGINRVTLTDLSYTMTLNPFDPGNPDAKSNWDTYLSAQTADSEWITPSGVNTDAPQEVYRVQTLIDLTGIDPATIVFDGFWVSDDMGLDVLVNGNPTGQTNTGDFGQLPAALPGNAFTLTQAHGLVADVNTIEFEWGNGSAGGGPIQFPDPTHVRIEFTGFTIVPVPPALWLFAPIAACLIRRTRAAPQFQRRSVSRTPRGQTGVPARGETGSE